MSNTERMVKLPGTVAFRLLSVVLNLAVLGAMFWVRTEVKNEIHAELSSYITIKEFETYQRLHAEWGDQVVKRLQASVDEANRRLDRMEAKIDRQAEKRASINSPDVRGLANIN